MIRTAAIIYSIITNKQFRSGPLPSEATRNLVLEVIQQHIIKGLPVNIFQFWGGAKNPNLPLIQAELCEFATLNNLKHLNDEVSKVYAPGLKIFIFPGDERIHHVNKIPSAHTESYVQSLIRLTNHFKGLFSVIPVSTLYQKYAEDFNFSLQNAKKKIGDEIYSKPGFDHLVANARKNITVADLNSEEEIDLRSFEAAKDYIIYRVAEEEAKIFRDFADSIRFSFIRFSPFYSVYKDYLPLIEEIRPGLNCVLHLYTGSKGNITQPWQAIGKIVENQIFFLSQQRLKTNKLLV